jgi:hypothetical protein
MASDNAKPGLPTELASGPAELIRREIELVLTDLAQRGRQVGVGAGMLGGAGILGVGAFAALTSAVIAALERRPSRGGFVVAAMYGAGAGTLTEAGVRRLRATLQAEAAAGADVDGTAAISDAPKKTAGTAAKGAKSSAKAVRRKAPSKAAATRKSPARAAKRKTAAKAARSASR